MANIFFLFLGRTDMKKILRLGSRSSPLALIQAQTVRDTLFARHQGLADTHEIEIIPIRTTGDWRPEQQERTFLEMGGNKGLFTKEIEEALIEGFVDFAVHSMKDVATQPPDSLDFTAVLERGDPHDAFLSASGKTLDELPSGARIGTSSLRRQSQIIARRPDVKVVPLRGNVDTRLRKLLDGEADATVLALAGLQRLGMTARVTSIMDFQMMLPSVAQGAIGLEIRKGDDAIRQLLSSLNCPQTMTCVSAERAMLKVLDGSCRTPIAGLAQIIAGDKLVLEGLVAKPNGSYLIRMKKEGVITTALEIGTQLGEEIKSKMPNNFFAA